MLKAYINAEAFEDEEEYAKSNFQNMAHIELLKYAKDSLLSLEEMQVAGAYERDIWFKDKNYQGYTTAKEVLKSYAMTPYLLKFRLLYLDLVKPNSVLLEDIEMLQILDSSTSVSMLEARILLINERYDESEKILKTLLSENDRYLYPRYYLARLYKNSGMYELARKELSTLKEYYPDLTLYKYELADILYEEKKDEKAIAVFHQFISEEKSVAWSYAKLGSIYMRNGDVDSAYIFLNQAIKSGDYYAPPYLTKARYLVSKNANKLAMDNYRKALEKDGDNIEALRELADMYIAQGNLDEPYRLYSKCIRLRRYIPDFQYQRAQIAYRNGNNNVSSTDIQNALKLDPGNSDYLLLKAAINNKTNKTESAIQILNRLLESGEENSEIYEELGLAFYLIGDYEKSISYCEKALGQDTGNATAGYLMGVNKLRTSQVEEAKRIFSKYSETGKSKKYQEQTIVDLLEDLIKNKIEANDSKRILKKYFEI